MEVCPTEVVFAPAERLWDLLTDPCKLAQWTGTTLVEGPASSMSAGDRVVHGAGPLRITFEVLRNEKRGEVLIQDEDLLAGATATGSAERESDSQARSIGTALLE